MVTYSFDLFLDPFCIYTQSSDDIGLISLRICNENIKKTIYEKK